MGFASIVPPDPDVSAGAETIAKVVDAPFGKRPFRVHVDPAQDGVEMVNTALDRVRAECPSQGLADVLTPRSAYFSVAECSMKREIMASRPLVPPFTRGTEVQKLRLAEDGWNSRDREKISLAYTLDSRWRNRSEFVNERAEIIAFLTRKWSRNWTIGSPRSCGHLMTIALPPVLHTNGTTTQGHWYRWYGNEDWEFGDDGLMRVRHASINDLPSRNRIASTIGRSTS